MKKLLLLIGLLILEMGVSGVSQVVIVDAGRIVTEFQGVPIFVENFTLQKLDTGFQLVASNTVQPPGEAEPQVLFQNIRTDDSFSPISYSLIRESANDKDIFDVSIARNAVTINSILADGTKKEENLIADSDILLFDSNSTSQFLLIFEKIKDTIGQEPARFSGLIPQASSIVPIVVKALGNVPLSSGQNLILSDVLQLNFSLFGQDIVVKLFSQDGVFIGFTQQSPGAPIIKGFRGDLFPLGFDEL